MTMYAKVRRMRYRDGLSISEITRRTRLSRNTVKTWLCEPVRDAMSCQRPTGPCKIDAHAEWLRLALGAWQGIFLWEHRSGPHRREVIVTLQGEKA